MIDWWQRYSFFNAATGLIWGFLSIVDLISYHTLLYQKTSNDTQVVEYVHLLYSTAISEIIFML